MGNTNIIELNGKRYDAVNGSLIADVVVTAKQSQAVHSPKHQKALHRPMRALDGIIRNSANPTKQKPQKVATETPKPSIQKAPFHRHHVHHLKAHPTERAKTLMRSSVKKPSRPLKATAHVQSALKHDQLTAHSAVVAKHSSIDAERLGRAQQTTKSNVISRFGIPQHHNVIKHVQPLAVKEAPKSTKRTVAQQATSPFETAIAQAVSHHEKSPQLSKRRRLTSRTISILATGATMILIASFFTYQNLPNINLRIASARAGFQATLPGYKPTGFAMGTMQYFPGQVSVSFRSNSDTRNFSVIEQNSSWDSQTLLDNFVSNTAKTYQTIENAGRTIYLYNGNATWVNGNIWYQIVNKSNLNTSQLVSIASSM